MIAARQVLDRIYFNAFKQLQNVCLRHPECMTARENRDTVFCQMRRAMDLIHYVIKDGVLESVPCSDMKMNGQSPDDLPAGLRTRTKDWDSNTTVYGAIKFLEESVEMTRVTLCGPAVRERLCQGLDSINERSQDFTDSAYTSHEHRQTILLLTDRIRLELNHLLRVGVSLEQREIPSPSDELESAISNVANATKELKTELQNTALEQV
ncbi:Alpha-catulin [Armadillidium vulgare]|nr:Alpha-catulin [Armadillidium vulgare]